MMKKVIGAVVAVAVLGVGFLAYRSGWLARIVPSGGRQAQSGPAAAAGGGVTTAATPGPSATSGPAQTGGASSGTGAASGGSGPIAFDGNLALLDLGAHVESVTSEHDRSRFTPSHLLDMDPKRYWAVSAKFPQEVVVSFFARQTALIEAVAVSGIAEEDPSSWPKDVEVWTSVTSPASGFTKVASAVLRPEEAAQKVAFPAVEARYVKLRVLSNHGDSEWLNCGKLKVLEAVRPGYTPLLTRYPDLAAVLSGTLPATALAADRERACAPVAAGSFEGCAPPLAAAQRQVHPPSRAESKNVLVVVKVVSSDDVRRDMASHYPPTTYTAADDWGNVDHAIYEHVKFTVLEPWSTRPAFLLPAVGIDTVVLAQVCDTTLVPDSFRKALAPWVAAGHKLIIHDADSCGSSNKPDYSFLPYPFATSNPGAQGASSDTLFFVEENQLANAKRDDGAFLDLERWLTPDENEIGDSNTITTYDAHWCGVLFGTNVKQTNGFMLAYAHHGCGLIIYDGFDKDQRSGYDYRQLVTKELSLGFDPDSLPCSARLGDFVITTPQRLKTLPIVPGRSYVYPLKLLSNQGYRGKVSLSLTSQPADPGLSHRFEPTSVSLEEIANTNLTATFAPTVSPIPHTLTVKGTDAAGKTNTLCLQLTERTTGGIQVVSAIRREKAPSKNLEIILDSSGSMKLPLGKKTRWTTAVDVLRTVVAKLPDDFNVGLRIYGHREVSTSSKTCTDSELVVPIQPLDRNAILSAAEAVKPKGETPLVYSVLQTPADLKAVRNGSVILITDGEESCKGDPKAAAQALKAAGVDITVNIVGFTVTGKQVQAALTSFAESTGGRFYSAQSGEALARVLMIAAVERFPYAIYDGAGKVVAKGEAGDTPEELLAGEYKVVITAGDQELTEAVTVTTAGDITLRVRLKGDKFVVER